MHHMNTINFFRSISCFVLCLFLLLSEQSAFAGAPQPQVPTSSGPYELVILNPTTGEQRVFQMNDYLRLNYDQFPDNPVKNQTLRMSGNLEAVTEDSIQVDGMWIAIRSITHISRPTIHGKQMTKNRMDLNMMLILFFPILLVAATFASILASIPGGEISRGQKILGVTGFLTSFASLVMIPVSILMQPRIKWKINKKRILLAKKSGA